MVTSNLPILIKKINVYVKKNVNNTAIILGLMPHWFIKKKIVSIVKVF